MSGREQANSVEIEDIFLNPTTQCPSRQLSKSISPSTSHRYYSPYYDDAAPTKRPVSSRLSRHNRGSILACTVLTKMLLYVLYAVGNAGFTEFDDIACEWLGVLQQWCVLSVILWMCIEAGNLFKLLRKASCGVDHPRAPCALIRKAVIAWGLPTMVVALQVILSLDDTDVLLHLNSDETQRCAPAPSLAFYLLPSLLFLLVDTAIFVCVWIRFTGGEKSQLPPHVSFIRRESALNFMLMILFTLTWGFELLTASAQHTILEAPRSTFMLIFATLIVLQDSLLVVSRCLCASCVGPSSGGHRTVDETKYGRRSGGEEVVIGQNGNAGRLMRRGDEYNGPHDGSTSGGSNTEGGVGHISPQTDDTNSNLLPPDVHMEESTSNMANIQTMSTDGRFAQRNANQLLLMQQSVTDHDFNGPDISHQHFYQPPQPPPPPPPRTSCLV